MARRLLRRLLWDYLSLSRGERRAVRVVGLLILAAILLRGFLPKMIRTEVAESTPEIEAFIAFRDSLQKLEYISVTHAGSALFPFDPNTAGAEDLIRLGIPEGTVRILMNYRSSGGRFRQDSDLLRVYGLREEDYRRLQPYIRIRQSFPGPGTEGGSRDKLDEDPWDRAEEDPWIRPEGFPPGGKAEDLLNRPVGDEDARMPLPFDLNRADSSQLVRIRGIGPVFARRIVRYRELLGGFYAREQLLEVYGLLPGQFAQLSRCTYLDTARLRKMDLNRLDERALATHPYLDRYQAGALVAYREVVGAFKHPSEIPANGLLPDSVFRKIEPYLEARE